MPNDWIKVDTFPCGQRYLDPSSVCISLSTEQYKGHGDFKPIYKNRPLRNSGENPKALSEAHKDTNRTSAQDFPPPIVENILISGKSKLVHRN